MLAMEQAITQVRAESVQLQQRNLQLEGMLEEQRNQREQQRQNRGTIDTRMIGKPKQFSGKDDDWSTWSLVLRAYCGAVSARMLALMEEVELLAEAPPANAALANDEDRSHSLQLYYILAMLSEGRAQDKVALVDRGEGMQLWGKLVEEYESKILSRKTGLLQQILGFQFTRDLAADLEKFDRACKHYEVSKSAPLDDDVKAGVVIRNLSAAHPDVAKHITMNSQRLNTYPLVRKELVDLLRTQKFMPGGDAMDIGAFNVADAKCHNCGKKGHLAASCWSGGSSSSNKGGKGGKGKGKGKNKGKKGGKANSTTPSPTAVATEKFQGECSFCGIWGHKRAQCRKLASKKQVNSVEYEGAVEGAGAVIDALTLNSVSTTIDALDLSAMDSTRKVRIGIDSGAGATVWPTHLYPDVPTVQDGKSGRQYYPAGKDQPSISDRGRRDYQLKDCSGQRRELKARVADVRKPLLAVSEMNDAGHHVLFYADGRGAFAEHAKTGKKTQLERSNGIFELVCDVMPPLGGGRHVEQ